MNPIPGFGGYFATEDGLIVSEREERPKVLKSRLDKHGYLVVTVAVYRGGKRQRHRMSVHRMVLLAFTGVPPVGMNVGRHLDGDKLNNRRTNLAWGTHQDNTNDAVRHGTLGPGMKAHRRKLDERQVEEIVARVRSGEPPLKLAHEFGVSDYYPAQLARGKCWSHLSL